MDTYKKHYVEFTSPGTMFAESSRRPIEAWDVTKACEMARDVTERHGAKPFAFHFITMLEANPVDDGTGGTMKVQAKELAKSCVHHLGGRLITVDEVKALNDPSKRILISNMEGNDFPIVIENTNSYRSTQPFNESDVVVDPATGEVIERGDAPVHVAYRKRKIAEHRAEMDRLYPQFAEKAAPR